MPVIVVDRPPRPAVATVATVAEAAAWAPGLTPDSGRGV